MANSTQNDTNRCAHNIPMFQFCDECKRVMVNDTPFKRGIKSIVHNSTQNKMRNAGICISCGKPMIVPANQMAGLIHEECEQPIQQDALQDAVQDTQNDWVKRFNDEFPCLMHFRPNKKSYGYSEVGNDVKAFIAKLLADARKEVIESKIKQVEKLRTKHSSASFGTNVLEIGYKDGIDDVLTTLKEEKV